MAASNTQASPCSQYNAILVKKVTVTDTDFILTSYSFFTNAVKFEIFYLKYTNCIETWSVGQVGCLID